MAIIPQLPTLYDEPFADSSAIPTFLVSQMAREHVKVVLSGDGGDELFSGYTRYTQCERLWRGLRLVPPRARAWGRNRLTGMSPDRRNRWAGKRKTLHDLLGITRRS